MSNHESTHGTTPLKHFTPAWWAGLFRGELTFGDTFWIGIFGVQFFFVPFWFTITFLAIIAFETALPAIFLFMAGFYAVYLIAIFPAVLMTALRNQTAGGWRWFGVFLALTSAAGAMLMFYLRLEV